MVESLVVPADMDFKAVSQLLWNHKGREEWFSFKRSRRATWLPRVSCPRHSPEQSCAAFFR